MSSSAAVEVIAVPESAYGVTPPLNTAAAGTVRFTSETLSGTPITATSAELRSDRMSGGQVVTGLESGGDINFELSSDPVYEDFFAGALMNNWVAGIALTAGSTILTKSPTDDQVATLQITGDFSDIDGAGRALLPGDVIILSGFTNEKNNVPVQIISVTDATHAEVVVPRASTTETAAAGIVTVGDYVDIGSIIKSWTLSKAYTDVLHLASEEQHSQRYTGSIVNGMTLTIAYGAIVTGTFTFLSNGYDQEHPSLHQKIDAAGGTVAPATTTNPLNGSVDVPSVTVDGEPTDFCIQTLTINYTNGATPQNCIGHIAPTRYNLGTTVIGITATIYLGDESYDAFMPNKLTLNPIGIMVATENDGGGYAFDLRAVQLTFPDPAAAGEQPVVIDATGTAKVGDNGESAIRIWRW